MGARRVKGGEGGAHYLAQLRSMWGSCGWRDKPAFAYTPR